MNPSSPHPTAQALAEIARGGPAGETATVAQHLQSCTQCRQIVRDLRGEGDGDAEVEAAWAALRPRLDQGAVERPTVPPPARSWALQAAAALLIFVAGALVGSLLVREDETAELTTRLERQIEELGSAHAQIVEIDLFPRGAVRGEGRDPQPTAIPTGTRLVLLNLLLIDGAERVRLEIVDSSGRRVSRLEALEPDDLGTITVALPRERFPAGVYLLKLVAVNAQGESTTREPVAEYTVRLSDDRSS